ALPGSRRDLEKQGTLGGYERLGLFQEPVRPLSCEPERVPEHDHLCPLTTVERRTYGVSQDPVRSGARTSRSDPGLGQEVQHLPRDVEGHPVRPGTSNERQEPARSRSEVEHPSRLDGVACQKALTKLPVEVPLPGPLVPLPFPVR